MTEIYLIRHGEAEGNVYRRLHGQYDSLLTQNGLAQVRALSRRFQSIPINACYSSDLIRTSLTAGAIYKPKGLPLRRDPAFRELNAGAWEDMPFGYLRHFYEKQFYAFDHDPAHWSCQGSEPFEVYTERFIQGLRRVAEEWDGGTAAVFCHGAVLRGVLSCLFFRPGDVSELPYADNTAVCRLFYDKGSFRADYLNDAGHLNPAISTRSRQKWWRASGFQNFNLWFLPAREREDALRKMDCDPDRCFSLSAGEKDAFVIAMAGEDPIGYVCLSPRAGRIEKLWISPGFRGQMREDQLLGHCVSVLRPRGFRRILAAEDAGEGMDLWDRYGFEREDGLRSMSIDTGCFDWDGAPEMI